MSEQLTRSFKLAEFECHDGTDVPPELVPNVRRLCEQVLQPIRDRWGALIVISGYRTAAYNTRVGGAKKSTHLTGEGADIRPSKFADVEELHKDILKMHAEGRLPALGGLGLYRGWVHVDIRKAADGHLRRWTGRGVGSENT